MHNVHGDALPLGNDLHQARLKWAKLEMDIAYLNGQRPADVLKMRCSDIRDGFLWVTQNKTGQKLRVESSAHWKPS